MSLDHPYIRLPSSLVGSIIRIDSSYSSTCALWPADNNSAAACTRCTSSACCTQKISIPKHDGHTYIQMQNEMQNRISCLMLRCSAIMLTVKACIEGWTAIYTNHTQFNSCNYLCFYSAFINFGLILCNRLNLHLYPKCKMMQIFQILMLTSHRRSR